MVRILRSDISLRGGVSKTSRRLKAGLLRKIFVDPFRGLKGALFGDSAARKELVDSNGLVRPLPKRERVIPERERNLPPDAYREYAEKIASMADGMEVFLESTFYTNNPLIGKDLTIIKEMFGSYYSSGELSKNFRFPTKNPDLKKAGQIASRLLKKKIKKAVFIPFRENGHTIYKIYGEK